MSIINYPFDNGVILKRKKALKRQLIGQNDLLEKRVAVLSGSTIGDIKDVLELFLLNYGIKPQFYIGQYCRFYEDIMFENRDLAEFKPDIIHIHTSARNLSDDSVFDKLQTVWAKIKEVYSCTVIQNNFELSPFGCESDNREINCLNMKIYEYASENKDFYVNDIQYLSAQFGLGRWFDEQDYFLYKYAQSVNAIPALCSNTAKIIKSIYGKNQKCLVLDLDNTLWGGVVGEVGAMGIELGMESAVGEAYMAFQKYVKALHDKGIVLAVCSKNDAHLAKEAFNNPNMVLRLDDITVFCANWDSKAGNIAKIAGQLNILPESMVFIDDNPAERELVRRALPEVKVPEVNNVVDFIRHIEGAGYFYAAGNTGDDMKRNEYYAADAKRNEAKNTFVDYGEYLNSLQMKSEIRPFVSEHLDRITQLINKTNQFNLTTKRYSLSEIEKITEDANYITLYATLDDKFGSNGIVSALIGELVENDLHIRLWVMSCRVFKRELEFAIFDHLVMICMRKNIKKLVGYYFTTEKNGYVANLMDDLGFLRISNEIWEFDMSAEYRCKNEYIETEKDVGQWIF
ncbi:MAG: HAD-IIIC family phosphatase [Synergistaceae bacterium]|nr:HAD-IIIC family phosphatase [Synergistaceae bacterium]